MKGPLALALLVSGCGGDHNVLPDAAMADTASADVAQPVTEGIVWLSQLQGPLTYSMVVASLGTPFATQPAADGCVATPRSLLTSMPAGSITVSGTTTMHTLSQQFPGDAYAAVPKPPLEIFTAGATLTATATGAAVPAFTGSVTAPDALSQITFPSSMSRSSAATITWTAGTGTNVMLMVTYPDGALTCEGPDTGSFTITTAALALVPASATTVQILGYRENETTTTAGAWTIQIRALDGRSSPGITLGP